MFLNRASIPEDAEGLSGLTPDAYGTLPLLLADDDAARLAALELTDKINRGYDLSGMSQDDLNYIATALGLGYRFDLKPGATPMEYDPDVIESYKQTHNTNPYRIYDYSELGDNNMPTYDEEFIKQGLAKQFEEAGYGLNVVPV